MRPQDISGWIENFWALIIGGIVLAGALVALNTLRDSLSPGSAQAAIDNFTLGWINVFTPSRAEISIGGVLLILGVVGGLIYFGGRKASYF